MDLITWTDKDLAVAMGSSNYPRESKVTPNESYMYIFPIPPDFLVYKLMHQLLNPIPFYIIFYLLSFVVLIY